MLEMSDGRRTVARYHLQNHVNVALKVKLNIPLMRNFSDLYSPKYENTSWPSIRHYTTDIMTLSENASAIQQ